MGCRQRIYCNVAEHWRKYRYENTKNLLCAAMNQAIIKLRHEQMAEDRRQHAMFKTFVLSQSPNREMAGAAVRVSVVIQIRSSGKTKMFTIHRFRAA